MSNASGYVSLMVQMSLCGGDEGVLQVAGELATRFNADVTGIIAYPQMPPLYQSMHIAYGVVTSDELVIQYEDSVKAKMGDAERRFTEALQAKANRLSWRSAIVHRAIPRFLARQARVADLFITHPARVYAPEDAPKAIDIGDIVMNIGRPVLLVPPQQRQIDLDTVLVGWKDTRATRRAVSDALPLLALAKHVIVAEVAATDAVADAERHTDEVCAWLTRHGIAAEPRVENAAGNETNKLAMLVRETQAGVLVAGAYGHSRFHEWALGGVTQDVLLHPRIPTFVSH